MLEKMTCMRQEAICLVRQLPCDRLCDCMQWVWSLGSWQGMQL